MNTGKFLKWEDFRETCRTDAWSWHKAGYKSDELTEDDILDEYPVDYFEDDENTECFDDESFFTPGEFAGKTLEYMRDLEEEDINKTADSYKGTYPDVFE